MFDEYEQPNERTHKVMSKKILFVDLFSHRGHYNFNKIYLQAINNIPGVTVDVVFAKGYVEVMGLSHDMYENSFVFNEYKAGGKGLAQKFLWRYHHVLRLFYCKRLLRKYNYDFVFVSSFDELTFSLFGLFGENVMAVYHQDANHLFGSSLITRSMRYLAKKINVIVLNKAYSERMNEAGVLNVFVPHGFLPVEKSDITYGRSIFIPINAAVDLALVQKLVTPRLSDLLVKLNVTMTIKHLPGIVEDLPNVTVAPQYILSKEYHRLFKSTGLILLPYDKNDYQYRTSAMLFESIAYGKYVAVPNAEAFLSLKCDGDTGMMVYESEKDILVLIENLFKREMIEKPQYGGVMSANSISVISDSLKRMMDEKR